MPKSIVKTVSRKEDIKIRGERALVYNYNNEVVELKNAIVWHDADGNYVVPEKYEEVECYCSIQ